MAKLELIETEIELKYIDTDNVFNIYLCKETLNIFAKEITEEKPRTLQFRVIQILKDEYTNVYKNNKANLDYLMSFYRHEYLTYRLGKYTSEDEVTIGDVFMYGHFQRIGGVL